MWILWDCNILREALRAFIVVETEVERSDMERRNQSLVEESNYNGQSQQRVNIWPGSC